MNMIELSSTTETTRLLDPAGNPIEQRIEHRLDPLTGSVASIHGALGEKAKAFLGTADVPLLRELEEKTREGCPFCAAATNRPGALADAIRASAEMVRRARAHDRALVHHVVGMNFLAPGGSSVPHPHFQVHVRGVPYSGISRLLRESEAFFARTGASFWESLLREEKQRGQRHIGTTGSVEWLAAWAPAHQKEIWGVLPGVASLADLSSAAAADFAEGISRVISFYEDSGTHPFTFAFLSSPRPDRAFALQVKLCARPAFRPMYSNYDTWFTPKLIGDDVHTEAPEVYAERLRARWGS